MFLLQRVRYLAVFFIGAALLATFFIAISTRPRPVYAATCTNTSTQSITGINQTVIPLSDLLSGTYCGTSGGTQCFPGGLYSDSTGNHNNRSAFWEGEGQKAVTQITPRDSSGNPSSTGKTVLLSIGMSNATLEWFGPGMNGNAPDESFMGQASASGLLSSKIAIVDGAISSQTADRVFDPSATTYWTNAINRVTLAGFTPAQVQIIWMKEAIANPGRYTDGSQNFPGDALRLKSYLKAMARDILTFFPNAKIMYLSSRIYGGYSNGVSGLNPEPYAYDSGYAVKWAIADQMNHVTGTDPYTGLDADVNYDPATGPVKAPWMTWGPYLWANGTTPRSDGLIWQCNDIANNLTTCDGVHPSANIDATSGSTCPGVTPDPLGQEEGGIHKAGTMLLNFFKTDTTSCSWFLNNPGSNCISAVGASPTPISTPIATPNPDIDHNGTVNTADLKLVLQNWLGNGVCGLFNCDVFADGLINAFDAVRVIANFTLPSPAPTPISTPTPSLIPTPTPITGSGVPYGPFHNSNLNRTFFNSTFAAGTEWSGMSQARSLHQHVFAAAANSDPCFYLDDITNPNSFNVSRLRADVLVRKSDILNYAADGTLPGLMELNEPHNPTSCSPIPAHFLTEFATGFWIDFPELNRNTFLLAIDAPPSYLHADNVAAGSPINLAFIQYTAKGGQTVDAWAAPLIADAHSQGMRKIIYSANLNLLGVDATVAANSWECQQTDAAQVLLWTDRYVVDTDASKYQGALNFCLVPR